MLRVIEAIGEISNKISSRGDELVALDLSVGRILAEDIFADCDLPPFDRAQMDGFALRSEEVRSASIENPVRLKIVGESVAGQGWNGEVKSGEAVRIMTGARVPLGADSIQKVELTRTDSSNVGSDAKEITTQHFVRILEPTKVGQFITPRASEITKGAKILSVGEVMKEQMIASLASFGYERIRVGRKPRVAIIATGSELVEINETPKLDRIRNSNTVALKVLAEKCGAIVETFPIASDDFESLKKQIADLLSKVKSPQFDILILTGGVSMGDYDFTKPALRELGAKFFFEKVALKPGKPTVFAKLDDTFVFGLPGNPVSAMVTFYLFVRKAILKLQGASETDLRRGYAALEKDVRGAKERDSYLPSRTSTNEKGQILVEPLPWSGSSDFVAFSRADALTIVPQGRNFEMHDVIEILFL